MIKKAVEKGLTQKNYYLGIKPLAVNFVEKHSYQLYVERHIIAVHLRIKPLVVNFVEKHSHQLSMYKDIS